MATNSCVPAVFLCVRDDGFYFEVPDIDANVDEDSFRISFQCCEYLIRCHDQKFLLLNDDQQFQLQNLTSQQQCQPDSKFSIQIYKDLCLDKKTGRAVMLYANKDGKKIVACCNDRHEVYPKEMVLPETIEKSADKALFYLMEVPGKTKKFMFESSLYPGKFLGFEITGEVDKLILRQKSADEVDEGCELEVFQMYT